MDKGKYLVTITLVTGGETTFTTNRCEERVGGFLFADKPGTKETFMPYHRIAIMSIEEINDEETSDSKENT